MRKRRYFFPLLISLIIICTAASAFLPYSRVIVKKISVQSDRKIIINKIVNLKTYALWYPWLISGTDVSATYADTISGKGSWMSWADEKDPAVNSYLYKIISVIPDSLVSFTLHLSDGFVLNGKYLLSNGDLPDHYTTLMWVMHLKDIKGGWLGALFSDRSKKIGEAMETGLINLKVLAEESQKYNGMDIEEIPIKETFVATISDTVAGDQLFKVLPEVLSDIKNGIVKGNIRIVGNPMVQIQILSGHNILLNAGFPVDRSGLSSGKIRILRMPPGHILCTEYHGEYKDVQKAYSALRQYARDHAKASPAPPWEEYLNGMPPRSDTDNCSMEVCYPVY